ncbi:MAG: PDZ domain-containing protein [Prosthecobacter sp.]|nr:PDZ domain-containing protein [Prosthecobacter sp.]
MAWAWAASLALMPLSTYAEPRAPLPPESRTNGKESSDSLASLRGDASAATARIVDAAGKSIITGTWLGKEGYVVTKASELPRMEKARLRTPDGKLVGLREVRREAAFDLVLAQVIDTCEVKAAEPAPSRALTFGQWLAAPAQGGKQFCIGVLSAQRREIKGWGAAMGVRMDDKGVAKLGGVRITGIAEDGPAAMAGLQENDVLLALAGERIAKYQRVHEIMSNRQPGEEIEVSYRRDGKETKVNVRLASRTKVLANWEGEDFANGGVSIRTDNFSQVLQHDLPLGPQDMGGPLLNLEGQVVGINIARVDRVTTFALPTEVFWPTVQRWIEADRHPPKGVAPIVAKPTGSTPAGAPAPATPGPRAVLHPER